MQYSVPTINFLLGWLAYHEELRPTTVIGFAMVWLALALTTADTLRRARTARSGDEPSAADGALVVRPVVQLRRAGFVTFTSAAILVACGGVDRGGSRDDIIEAMRDQGLEADVDCVGHVLDGFSDGALEAIDEQLREPTSTDPQTLQFLEALRACTPPTTITP